MVCKEGGRLMRKQLEITLQSDLCAGVGKHFAAMIDLDTAVDEYGIPYIPSRRLKGCMREAAEFIGIDNIDAVFGKNGEHKAGSLSISDAKIYDYNKTISELSGYNFNANEVTNLFCSVRAETAIDSETGTAEDKSLRYIRVVNRLALNYDENMKFYSTIEYDDIFDDDISKIVNALRNIGYHRNRGLGAVTCILTDDSSDFHLEGYDFKDDEEYEIKYTVHLESDLMLPSNDVNHSLDYIPGTSVLGAFAAKYVKKYGDGEFNNIFYSNDVKFSNLYISKYDADSNSYIDFHPVCRFLAKIKAAGEEAQGIYNTIGIDMDSTDETGSKKQYKPLKKGYINFDYGYAEPDKKIVYHNAVNSNDDGLYMQYCLCSNQVFSGTITGIGNKIAKIYELFKDGKINFGRSKTAQYSYCTIKNIEVSVVNKKLISSEKGNICAFVLESDAVLVNEDGVFSVDFEDLLSELNLTIDDVREETSIAAKTVSGYNSKWNHKKIQIPVISAGSSIVFNLDDNKTFDEYFVIGEKINEGFGSVCFIKDADKLNINANKITNTQAEASRIIKELEKQRLNSNITYKAIEDVKEVNTEKTSLAAAQIGRITLMCEEANSLDDFYARINSIKTDSVRETANAIFSEEILASAVGKDADWKNIQKYIITVLTIKKYRLRREKKVSE